MNPPVKASDLPFGQGYSEVEINEAIDSFAERMALLRRSLKEQKPMKFALESLPELIGENQFRDLCIALGIDTTIQVPTGHDFASIIRVKLLKHYRDEERARHQPQKSGLPL